MRESELLSHIYTRSKGLPAPVEVGPGDDAAVLRIGDASLLVTVDQLIERRHFAPATSIDLISRKAVARSVSDIAAMAGKPIAGFATAALPKEYAHADALFDAMAKWALHWGCPLAGGDIATLPNAQDPMVLTVTVMGHAHAVRGAVLRSGAVVGDAVYVTGALGGSLDSGRHLSFAPRIEVAKELADTLDRSLHAMLDISDGLGTDAARIAEASGVRIELEAAQLPVHDGADGWRAALGDGEDYELCFAVAADAEMPTAIAGVPITHVGNVVEGAGCAVRIDSGAYIDASEFGWEHGA